MSEIKNYYSDITVLGEIDTYKKYKDKIEQIITEGTSNRELKIIPSVYEERFDLEVLPNNNLKKVCDDLNSIESLFETRKDFTKKDKYKIFNNILKINDMNNKPIFIMKDKENQELVVSLYPILKNTRNNDVYLSYYTIASNQKYKIKYGDHSMMIGYLTNPGVEDRIKQYMYEIGQEFQKDISPFMINESNLSNLKYVIEDNLFYENYRSPLIALRENGIILEITKENGKLISSLYSSDNNVDKCELINRIKLDEELNFNNIENEEELKKNCRKLIAEQLKNQIVNNEEVEEEAII